MTTMGRADPQALAGFAAARSEQARFLTMASLKWVIANRAYTPWYLVRYWRAVEVR